MGPCGLVIVIAPPTPQAHIGSLVGIDYSTIRLFQYLLMSDARLYYQHNREN